MYRALYRTYRPGTFNEVYGQQHITDVLKSQIKKGRIAHAYLFSGPRGTGKTSCAKIFAKAINCTEPKDGEPCCECGSCRAIAGEGGVDVIEMDAASNSGVSNIREIREKALLLPTVSKYKVYIIDEAHSLSSDAFNALLKTLEEPPAHVVFILATTEPRKIPVTILSRCQRFDFKRISTEDIYARLCEVCARESITYDEDALRLIAAHADGAMRDALSVLDQVRAGGVTAKQVLESMGGADTARLLELAGRICAYDEQGAVLALESLVEDGTDCGAIIRDLTSVFRDIYAHGFLKVNKSLSYYYDDISALAVLAETFGKAQLLRAIDVFLEREFDVRQSSQPEIALLSAVLRVMSPETDGGPGERLDKIERELVELKKRRTAPLPEPVKPKAELKAPPVKKSASAANWPAVLSELKKEDAACYNFAKLCECMGIADGLITLLAPKKASIAADVLKSKRFSDIIKKICDEKFGQSFELKLIEHKAGQAPEGAWSDVVEI